MKRNRNKSKDELEFDRDTSAPKNKMKSNGRFSKLKLEKESKSVGKKVGPASVKAQYNRKSILKKSSNSKENKNNNNNKKIIKKIKKEDLKTIKLKKTTNKKDENNKKSVSKEKKGMQKEKKDDNNIEVKLIEKQDASAQVDVLSKILEEKEIEFQKKEEEFISKEEEYKIKINEYEKKSKEDQDKINELLKAMEYKDQSYKKKRIDLENEINQRRDEILKLTKLNNKYKTNLEKMSQKLIKLYNKIMENNKLTQLLRINNIKDIDSSISDVNSCRDNSENAYEVIKIKDKQIKDSLSMISYLTRQKYKLKEELFNIKDQNKSLNNEEKKLSLFSIKNYNFRDYSQNETPNGNSEQYEDGQTSNSELFKKKINYSLTIYRNLLLKQRNNAKRATSSSQILESKRKMQENVNAKIDKLFNESERKALSTLFDSEKEFEYFNQKMNILHKHNSVTEKNMMMKIKQLTAENHDKNEQIQYLQDKLKECESKIKILEHRLNCEKFLLKRTKKDLQKSKELNSPKNEDIDDIPDVEDIENNEDNEDLREKRNKKYKEKREKKESNDNEENYNENNEENYNNEGNENIEDNENNEE